MVTGGRAVRVRIAGNVNVRVSTLPSGYVNVRVVTCGCAASGMAREEPPRAKASAKIEATVSFMALVRKDTLFF